MRMVRKQLYITQEQDELLKRMAEERGQTEAEVMRAALDGLIGVKYEAGQPAVGRLGEAALMEYNAEEQARTSIIRHTVRGVRSRLEDEIWQRELAFIKSLAETRKEGGTTERFNREELYEERLSKLLR